MLIEINMKPSVSLQNHREEIRRVVAQNRARNPRVFGSVLRGHDNDDSDLDLLVDPTTETTLFDLARIQRHLQSLLGVPVDVKTPNSLPEKFRNRVLLEAVPV
jgi:predicted nucleotidyltransferase